MKILKVGLISHKFEGTKARTIARSIELIARAAAKGAQLIVLQELHQTHYFCQRENTENFDYAQDFECDLRLWSEVAKRFGVVLVSSLFERRAAGLYHNTAVVFERDGRIAGKYRKMHIPDDPQFYEKFYFTPGDLGFEPIDTSVGRLGVLVCWDQWYPEAARAMALRGAELLIYPTAIGWFDGDGEDEKARQLEAWVAVQRGHAVANSLPVIAVNRVGFESAALSEVSPDEILSGGNKISPASDGGAASDKILRSVDAGGDSKILSEGGILSFNNGALTDSGKMAIGGEILPAKNEAARENLKISIEIKFNGETLEVLPNKQRVDQLASEEGIRFWGNSFVFGAQGEQLFRANSTDELCEVVTIDMQRCENVRRWWPFLRDRRVEEYGILTKRYGL
ncbi:carbon-nitrogen hydrolase [uncultured Campylobacter sp.]|uniref:carbon-nitrogen hydrolase n=1 Tax=uncultured Campylobacter sp. TaxID=218934 RepID=UPI00260D2DFA|nr:carbon-nitrogen hydrolase [uncultured Campylobacter sp.]